MKRRRLQSITFLIMFVYPIFFSLQWARADHIVKKIRQTTESGKNDSSHNPNETSGTTWISKTKMRQDEGDSTVIIRMDKQKLFVINHLDKTYSELDLPLKLEENLAPQAKQFIQALEISSSIMETQEVKEIKGWKSRKIIAHMSISMMGMDMPMTMEIWTSQETGIDLKFFRKFYAVLLSMNPFTNALLDQFEKIEGFPVLTKISMRVKDSETVSQDEVISIEEMKAPKGTFDLPAGYTKIAYNPLCLGITKREK